MSNLIREALKHGWTWEDYHGYEYETDKKEAFAQLDALEARLREVEAERDQAIAGAATASGWLADQKQRAEKAEARVAELEAVIEWYADRRNWDAIPGMDDGQRARDALRKRRL